MSLEGEQNQPANAPAPTPGDSEGFDAAFQEAADLYDGKPPAPAAVPEQDQAPAGTEDAPSPAPAADQEDAADDDGSPPADTPTIDDIWKNAPPELREAHEKQLRDMDLRYRSSQGRVSALDRELARYRSQQQGQPAPQQERQPEEQPSAEPKADPSAKEKALAELRDEYPDLAGPLLDEMAEMRARLERLDQGYGAIEQQRATAAVQQQEQRLLELHPDYADAARDERFMGWLETKPQAVKDAFQRNFHSIVDAEDAALVIGMFKNEMGIGATGQQASPQPSAQQPAPSQRRQRQLNSGRDAGGNGPAAAAGVPNDFEAAFNHAANLYSQAG